MRPFWLHVRGFANLTQVVTIPRLVAIEELRALGELPPGRVITFSEALRVRDEAEYGRRSGRRCSLRQPMLRRI